MQQEKTPGRRSSEVQSLGTFIELSRSVMYLANRPVPRVTFLQDLSNLLLQFSDCDLLEIRACGEVEYHLQATAKPEAAFSFGPPTDEERCDFIRPTRPGDGHPLQRLVLDALGGTIDLSEPCFTSYGSFWTSDIRRLVGGRSESDAERVTRSPNTISMALIPFAIDEANFGLLRLECSVKGSFSHDTIEAYEAVAETIGLAIAQRRGQAALHERVKELSCLYGIARAIENAGQNMILALDQIVSLLPPAWQYPEIAVSRIIFDDRLHGAAKSVPTVALQSADIVVGGVARGRVEVGYVETVKYALSGPFLQEEEHLIQAVAREIGDYVVRCETATASRRLEEQLHHADRLATI
ncbi:MAG: hypothetical protein JSW51_12185, partial [Gemmatimonadota bacterium]